jgi:activator of 2-hydroxyglutaryl-CoA dehydratase
MITLGIDVGSLFTKAVLLENDRILSTAIRETSGTINLEAGAFIDLLLSEGGVAKKMLQLSPAPGRVTN